MAKSIYQDGLHQSVKIKKKFIEKNHDALEKIAVMINDLCASPRSRSLRNKVISCGNGGSACDASHFVGELVGRFVLERSPIAALVLASDPATMTAIANDYGYDKSFSRAAAALVQACDVFVGFSTSGKSPNVVDAARVARQAGAAVVAFVGAGKSPLADLADFIVSVDSKSTARIQECHIFGVHLICERLDQLISREKVRAASKSKTKKNP